MQEVVARVRADFGPEAVILQTRRVRAQGLWGLLGRRRVEVIAALDERPRQAQRTVPNGEEGSSPVAGPVPPAWEDLAASGEPAATAPPVSPGPPRPANRSQLDSWRVPRFQGQSSGSSGLTGVSEGKGLASSLSQPSAAGRAASRYGGGSRSEDLRWLEQHLIFLGLPPAEVAAILQEVSGALVGKPGIHSFGIRGQQARRELEEALVRSLAARIVTVEPWSLERPPYFAALVGPTGVGKTTTVAKLAANYAIAYGKKVGLIAADTYRIGAVDQLRQYAQLIGVPLEVVENERDMARAAARLKHLDLILVDTVGRSQRDEQQLMELRSLLSAVPQLECHLVVSATTRFQDLEDVVERFSCLKPVSVIVTKIDETTSPVAVFNATRLSGRPLSFITAGQRVPEDIEVAEPVNVARAIVGELP